MITIIFVGALVAIILGFILWVTAFGGTKRRGQSGMAEVREQHMPKDKRSS